MEKMTQLPPPAHNPAGTSIVHIKALIGLAQNAEGEVQEALLAGARAICRRHLHQVRNKASRRLRGLPVYLTPSDAAAVLVNPPMADVAAAAAKNEGDGR